MPGDPARVHFLQQRPGESIDYGPLTGVNISREQLRVHVQQLGLLIDVVGDAATFVDGARVQKGCSAYVRPGAVIQITGNCVLLVTVRPNELPAISAALRPLAPFGDPDGVGNTGESPAAWALRNAIAAAAISGRHVLILGPTGTGKELAALGIHMLSPRASGPMIRANAADFADTLVASLLYGNPRGYPNAGSSARPGFFGAARGGTLLLDEIGELRPDVQSPLLRALDGEYNRVGDSAPSRTECIVIMATNRDPSFIKEDVRFRLKAVVRTVALTERREDIPLLVRARLLAWARENEKFAKAFVRQDSRGNPSVEVDASLIVGLLRSPLPGNIRELDTILTDSVAAAGGKGPLRWPGSVPMPPPAEIIPEAPHPSEAPAPVEPDVDELLEGLRRVPNPPKARVAKALEDCHWRFAKAAATLGISVNRLYRLRVKYDLHPPT